MSYIAECNKKEKQIDYFLVSETSRISRLEDTGMALSIENKINSLGVDVVKVSASRLNTKTDEGLLFTTMDYAFAAYERKKILKRAHIGKKNRIAKGYRPFGMPPL